MLESGRAQSRPTGVAVSWRVTAQGFEFAGLTGDASCQTDGWGKTRRCVAPALCKLGPEPLIDPQTVVLVSASQPDRALQVSTDGLRPFAVSTWATP